MIYRSPVGDLYIESSGGAVTRIMSVREGQIGQGEETPAVRRCIAELEEYFRGCREEFTVPVDISFCTSFQQNVLGILRSVPYGSTVSYGQFAELAGVPGGGRAVGNVMRKNPVPIMFPCHRVIRSDGSCGGFGMGIEAKKELLLLEKRNSHGQKAV